MKKATMTIKGDVETLLDIVEDIIAIYDSNIEINLKIEEEKDNLITVQDVVDVYSGMGTYPKSAPDLNYDYRGVPIENPDRITSDSPNGTIPYVPYRYDDG